jgi:hypothetical protein
MYNMPTFLITTALVVAGSLGFSHATSTLSYHNVQVINPDKNAVSADNYYFQSWNCLTDF